MQVRIVVICLMILLVTSAAAWLLVRGSRNLQTEMRYQEPGPVEITRKQPDGEPKHEVDGPDSEAFRVARCPMERPIEEVDALKDVIGGKPETLLRQFRELERLETRPLDPAASEWLRWLIYQDDRHETLRNEVGKVLLNWNPDWLVGDLAAMMEDPAQSEIWRNYCVQHLWAHRTKYKDDASLKAVEKAASAPDWVIRSQGVFSLANIAREENWKETQPQRLADLSAKLKQAIQAAREKGYSHGPSAQIKYDTPEQKAKATERVQKYQITSEDLESAFVAVQVLELMDLAPEAEAFAGDESNDLAVRAAAVRALITVGRSESIAILEKCAASNHRVLAKLASLALKRLAQGAKMN